MKNSSDTCSHVNRFIKLVWKDIKEFITTLVPLILFLLKGVVLLAGMCLFAWYITTAVIFSLVPEYQLDTLPLTSAQLGWLMAFLPVSVVGTLGIGMYVSATWEESK